MNSPSRPTRESTTRSSVWPQNGHFIRALPSLHPLGVQWEAARQLLHVAPHRRLDRGGAEIRERAVDQLRDPLHLGFFHPPRRDGGPADPDAAAHHATL